MKTIIKIDSKLLREQIQACVTKAINASDSDERNLFDGIENLLSEIDYALEEGSEIEFEQVKQKQPCGKMTIRDLIKYRVDIDIYNNVTDEESICLCCPLELTSEGEKKWENVLDYSVDVTCDRGYYSAECICDDDPNIKWEIKAKKLNQFLYSVAGYCSDEDYNKWFK